MSSELTHFEMIIILTEEAAKLGIKDAKFKGERGTLVKNCLRRAFNHGLEQERPISRGECPGYTTHDLVTVTKDGDEYLNCTRCDWTA